MHRLVWGKCVLTVTFCLSLLTPGTSTQAAIIHESATLGPIGQLPNSLNPAVAFDQFLGSRFSLTETIKVDQIGGHFVDESAIPGRTIFGAIVSLQSSSALPNGGADPFDPFDSTEVQASTTFTTPNPSADILVPLSVTLTPGDYAVIFGAGGHLGESIGGLAAMPDNNTDIVGSASYFQWIIPFGPPLPEWRDNPAINNIRFVVTGNPVPVPSAMLLFGTGLVGLVSWRWWSTKNV